MAYVTSELYKKAIKKEYRTTNLTGKITTKKGTIIEINNDIIDAGSTYITNQCVSSDYFHYGSVFSAEAGITLKNTEVDRYSLYDAEIILNFNILLEDGTYESIPLGKFYVSEPNRIGKNITIKAYDRMLSLDKDIEESTSGKPYEFLLLIETKCNVEIAQTQEEVEALTNGDKLFSLNIDMVETYRDLLSYICTVTCTYAFFDREGKLRLQEFSNLPSFLIDAKIRTSSKFSDFESYHTAVKAQFLVSGSYKTYVKRTENDDGLLYNIGEIPIVQGTKTTNQEIIDNISEKLFEIRYVPCEISFYGDPSIDMGDMITCIDRQGNEIPSVVTFYKWSYRGEHKIKSVGANPKLASVKEKKKNDLSNIQAELNSKSIPIYTYTNISDLLIKQGENVASMTEIIKITFSVDSNDTTSIFMATIPFTMDRDGFIEFVQLLDCAEYSSSNIIKHCLQGENVITLINYIPCKMNSVYSFSVVARTFYKETDLRIYEAKVKTNENARNSLIEAYEKMASLLANATDVPISDVFQSIEYDIVQPDTTVPTASIKRFGIKALVFGQGLTGEIPWDGTIVVNDVVKRFNISHIDMKIMGINDNVIASNPITSRNSISINLSPLQIRAHEMKLKELVDTLITDEVVTNYTFNTDKAGKYEYDENYVIIHDSGYELKSSYSALSNEQPIDSGRMCSISFNTPDYKSVTDIKLEVK